MTAPIDPKSRGFIIDTWATVGVIILAYLFIWGLLYAASFIHNMR